MNNIIVEKLLRTHWWLLCACFILINLSSILCKETYKEFANWRVGTVKTFIRCYVVVERHDCEQPSDIRQFRITTDTADTVVTSYGRTEHEISNRLRDTVVPQVVLEQPVEFLQWIRHGNRRNRSFNPAALHREFSSKHRQQSKLSHVQVTLEYTV